MSRQFGWKRGLLRGAGLGMLLSVGLVGCETESMPQKSLLGVEIPADFTFETAQDVRVVWQAPVAEKVEVYLPTGEKVFEGPSEVLQQLELTVPSYQRQLQVVAGEESVELSISNGVAQ